MENERKAQRKMEKIGEMEMEAWESFWGLVVSRVGSFKMRTLKIIYEEWRIMMKRKNDPKIQNINLTHLKIHKSHRVVKKMPRHQRWSGNVCGEFENQLWDNKEEKHRGERLKDKMCFKH